MKIFDGLSRPMRAGGLALLGVAAIAVILGSLALLTGGDDDPQEIATPHSSQDQPSGEDAGDDADDGEGDGSSSDGPENGEGDSDGQEGDRSPDGSAQQGSDDHDEADAQDSEAQDDGDEQDADPDEGSADQETPIRVYNNSKVSGLGAEAGDEFRAKGWDITEVNNYARGTIPTSTAYYRPDTDEERAAHALARQFGMRAEPRFEGIADSDSGVIVIVTQDYSGPADGK